MFSKSLSVIVFALCLSSIVSEKSSPNSSQIVSNLTDWCPLVKPNDTYGGLGIYRYYNYKDKGIGDCRMYNRGNDGKGWRFTVNDTEKISLGEIPTLQMIEYEPWLSNDTDLIHRFGFYLTERSPSSGTFYMGGNAFDCTVRSKEGNSSFLTKCTFNAIDTKPTKYIEDITTIFYPNSVIFKSYTDREREVDDASMFHVFDKKNKNSFFVYKPLEKGSEQYINCSKTTCIELGFVKDIDDSLFSQIDDVIHLDVKETHENSGHLVLFNIEGRPKYCYIPLTDSYNNEYSAAECKTKEDLHNLFDHCFPTTDPPLETVGKEVSSTSTERTQLASNGRTVSSSMFAVSLVLIFSRL